MRTFVLLFALAGAIGLSGCYESSCTSDCDEQCAAVDCTCVSETNGDCACDGCGETAALWP